MRISERDENNIFVVYELCFIILFSYIHVWLNYFNGDGDRIYPSIKALNYNPTDDECSSTADEFYLRNNNFVILYVGRRFRYHDVMTGLCCMYWDATSGFHMFGLSIYIPTDRYFLWETIPPKQTQFDSSYI